MLQGKAKKDFFKWYLEPEQKKTYKTLSNKGGDKAIMLNWYSLSDAHRYGVIVYWFKSVDIEFGKSFNSDDSYWILDKDSYNQYDNLTKKQQFDKAV